jgi:hypothetical protein
LKPWSSKCRSMWSNQAAVQPPPTAADDDRRRPVSPHRRQQDLNRMRDHVARRVVSNRSTPTVGIRWSSSPRETRASSRTPECRLQRLIAGFIDREFDGLHRQHDDTEWPAGIRFKQRYREGTGADQAPRLEVRGWSLLVASRGRHRRTPREHRYGYRTPRLNQKHRPSG